MIKICPAPFPLLALFYFGRCLLSSQDMIWPPRIPQHYPPKSRQGKKSLGYSSITVIVSSSSALPFSLQEHFGYLPLYNTQVQGWASGFLQAALKSRDRLGSDGSVETFLFHIVQCHFYDDEIQNGDF